MEQMQITHSEELYSRAKELMPGGVNSPVRAFQSVGGTPRFIQRAKDQYLSRRGPATLILIILVPGVR